jgi:hypothetical protein
MSKQFRKIFLAFRIPRGSKCLLHRPHRRERMGAVLLFQELALAIPTPCAPLHEQPGDSARATIFLSRSHAQVSTAGSPRTFRAAA